MVPFSQTIRSLSYRKRCYLLVAATVVFTVIAYLIAIVPTLNMYSQYQSLATQSTTGDQLDHTDHNLVELKKQLDQSLTYLRGYQSDTSRTDPLLSALSPLCNRYGVRIEALFAVVKTENPTGTILTRSVRLQGSYHALLQVVDQIENQLKVGRLASVEFTLNQDILRRKQILYADCYLQQLEIRPK